MFMFKMIYTENINWITKYFLFSALILFHLCFAQDETDLNWENHEGMTWKPTRRLLWHDSDGESMTGPELVVYIIGVIIISSIAVCCKYCCKPACEQTADDYSDAVTHAPPYRRILTAPVVPSSGGRRLNPPRNSGSVILPPEERVFSVDFTGIENPNYNPSIHVPAPSYYSPTASQFSTNYSSNENPTPLLDLPPSYESVIREQKLPKEN